MQIFVRTLRGSTLALEAEGTVEDAKRIIAEREGERSDPPYQSVWP